MSTRIYRACDFCEVEGVDSPGEIRGPMFGRTLDVCATHWDTITVKELVALVEERGAPADASGATPARRRGRPPRTAAQTSPVLPGVDVPHEGYTCPLCDTAHPTNGALGKHVRAAHGTSLVDLYGNVCPVCGADPGGGTHIGRAHHGIGGLPGGFAWAEANGDPHGAVAARRAVWARM